MPVSARLSIPRRVFLGFALVLAVSGLVSVASFVQHQRTAASLRLLQEGYLPLSLAVSEVRAVQSVFDNLLGRLGSDRHPAATRAWLNVGRRSRPEHLARALNSIALLQDAAPPASERATLAKLRRELRRVRAAVRDNEVRYEALNAALDAGDQSAVDSRLSELRVREQAIDARLRGVWTTVLRRIKATSERASEREQQAIVVLVVLAVIALLVGVAVTWWAQRVLSPLPKLQERVEAVARGDLMRRLGPTGDDEIGLLAREFERMVDALSVRDQRLRELQQTQAQILSDLSAAVVVVGGDGQLRTANPAAAALLGLDADATGVSLAETGLQLRLSGLSEAMAAVTDTGQPCARFELPLTARAGDDAPVRYLNLLVRPFGGEPHAEPALLLVAEDVTEALATKTRLIQTERLAAIGRMAAHITHEIRNPLSSIGLNVEMLEEELSAYPDPEARVMLGEIHREIERLRGVTEEYLRLARLPSPALEPEDLGDLVTETARFVERELSGLGVTLSLRITPGLALVAIDEAQLRQVLINLLRNAREALGSQGGAIEVSVQPASKGQGGVQLRVRDDGVGMDEATRARIFDLFYTTKQLGTGLGLPLTQQIVLAHGGTIECDSAPGRGTTFTLWFPACGDSSTGDSNTGDADGKDRADGQDPAAPEGQRPPQGVQAHG